MLNNHVVQLKNNAYFYAWLYHCFYVALHIIIQHGCLFKKGIFHYLIFLRIVPLTASSKRGARVTGHGARVTGHGARVMG